jgi:hypothetical protein
MGSRGTAKRITTGGGARTVAAAAALATVAVVAGCGGAQQARLDFSTTENVRITDIWVAGGSGNITIRGGAPVAPGAPKTPATPGAPGTPGPTGTPRPTVTQTPPPRATATPAATGSGAAGAGVRIDRVVRYRGPEPGRTYRIEGTALYLDTDCGLRCGVSYVVHAPAGVAIHGETDSGDLLASDVGTVDVRVDSGSASISRASGDVKVVNDSGDVRLSEIAGNLTLDVGSGEVEARSVGGTRHSVTVDSGDVTLVLDKAADVTARIDSGDVEITVPPVPYRVDANSDSGDVDITVPNDPAAKHRLQITVDSGDVTVLAH